MLSYVSGAIRDLSSDEGIADLHRRVRSVLRTVRSPEACQYEWGVQHLTLGYAYAEADSDHAQRLLRRVRPSHAPLHIDEVHLADARADHQARQITREQLARIPLGGGRLLAVLVAEAAVAWRPRLPEHLVEPER